MAIPVFNATLRTRVMTLTLGTSVSQIVMSINGIPTVEVVTQGVDHVMVQMSISVFHAMIQIMTSIYLALLALKSVGMA